MKKDYPSVTQISLSKRILVCGGRDFKDKKTLYNFLDNYCLQEGLHREPDEYGNWMPKGITIIHGGARGADLLANDWAIVNWVPVDEFKADWDTHGRAAGAIRNKQMLDSGIDAVIACPGGSGTAHMKKIAKKAGVEVIEIPDTKQPTLGL